MIVTVPRRVVALDGQLLVSSATAAVAMGWTWCTVDRIRITKALPDIGFTREVSVAAR